MEQFIIEINIWNDYKDVTIRVRGDEESIERYKSGQDDIFDLAENCKASDYQMNKIYYFINLRGQYESIVKYRGHKIQRY